MILVGMITQLLKCSSTDIVLKAYEKGLFPMSDSNYDPYTYWVEPKERGIIDLKDLKFLKA